VLAHNKKLASELDDVKEQFAAAQAEHQQQLADLTQHFMLQQLPPWGGAAAGPADLSGELAPPGAEQPQPLPLPPSPPQDSSQPGTASGSVPQPQPQPHGTTNQAQLRPAAVPPDTAGAASTAPDVLVPGTTADQSATPAKKEAVESPAHGAAPTPRSPTPKEELATSTVQVVMGSLKTRDVRLRPSCWSRTLGSPRRCMIQLWMLLIAGSLKQLF